MSVTHGELSFRRLGHASVRIETDDGTVVYIDPWSDVIDGQPGDADVVFVTHDDADHWDPGAIAAVSRPGTVFAVYERIDAGDPGGEVVELPYEGEVSVAGIGVETVPAYNDPDGEHVDEDGEPFHAEGEVIGLVLSFDSTTVLFTSDTDVLPVHESVDADVLVPPIGGHFTMDRHEAVDLVRAVDPELVLPVHYDTFEAIETDAEAFAAAVEGEGHTVELF